MLIVYPTILQWQQALYLLRGEDTHSASIFSHGHAHLSQQGLSAGGSHTVRVKTYRFTDKGVEWFYLCISESDILPFNSSLPLLTFALPLLHLQYETIFLQHYSMLIFAIYS